MQVWSEEWQQRAAVAAAAAATLAVVAGPLVAVTLVPSGLSPSQGAVDGVAGHARRALEELPYAYLSEGEVIVPAVTDPAVDWGHPVRTSLLDSPATPLAARAKAPYTAFTGAASAPDWTTAIGEGDEVYSDLGPLWFSCARWPGEEDCFASLLLRDDGRFYFFESGLGSDTFLSPGAAMEIFAYDVVGDEADDALVLGGLPGTSVDEVRLLLGDGSHAPTLLSVDRAVRGATIWWTSVSQPVLLATAYDARGRVLSQVALD